MRGPFLCVNLRQPPADPNDGLRRPRTPFDVGTLRAFSSPATLCADRLASSANTGRNPASIFRAEASLTEWADLAVSDYSDESVPNTSAEIPR
jgi:hypothetical protein